MSRPAYYDEFLKYQLESGINDRIHSLYKRLLKTNITENTSILEIGCGIGCLTFLASKHNNSGHYEATDLSPKSIEYASSHQKAKHLSFVAANIMDFEPKYKQFDRILMFDVLEHIPMELHADMFQKISSWMHEDSLLLINIPNPDYIKYDEKYDPEALQELDQPIYMGELATKLNNASLDLYSFETYGLWVKDEYQFMVIKKRSEFKKEDLSSKMSLLGKVALKLKRSYIKMKYSYPKG